MNDQRILGDTSLFIGLEQGRLSQDKKPANLAVSIVTIGELKLGVLTAKEPTARAKRLRTLTRALALEPLQLDDPIADAWAELHSSLKALGKKMPVNDSWIAATAIAHKLPVATQDDDYDDVPGLNVVKL